MAVRMGSIRGALGPERCDDEDVNTDAVDCMKGGGSSEKCMVTTLGVA